MKLFAITIQALILSLSITGSSSLAQTLELPSNLIPFNSVDEEKLLINSENRTDYFPLSIHFITQQNQAFCGVASMVMVLNALNIPAPEAPEYPKFRTFTQDNFFNNEKTSKVTSANALRRRGMN
ncbi:MAG: glutathione gamma-glutamylcysteinyltransferase, partial [Pseudanabaena frigida]